MVYIKAGYPEGRDGSVWHAVNHLLAGVTEWSLQRVAARHPEDEIPLLPGVRFPFVRSALRLLGVKATRTK